MAFCSQRGSSFYCTATQQAHQHGVLCIPEQSGPIFGTRAPTVATAHDLRDRQQYDHRKVLCPARFDVSQTPSP
jgi:hypothetical protein